MTVHHVYLAHICTSCTMSTCMYIMFNVHIMYTIHMYVQDVQCAHVCTPRAPSACMHILYTKHLSVHHVHCAPNCTSCTLSTHQYIMYTVHLYVHHVHHAPVCTLCLLYCLLLWGVWCTYRLYRFLKVRLLVLGQPVIRTVSGHWIGQQLAGHVRPTTLRCISQTAASKKLQ